MFDRRTVRAADANDYTVGAVENPVFTDANTYPDPSFTASTEKVLEHSVQ